MKFDENPKHITYLGNLHMDGVVTKTEKVEQGIRRKNREIDRRNIAQRINVSNIEHKKVDLDKSQTPNTERE